LLGLVFARHLPLSRLHGRLRLMIPSQFSAPSLPLRLCGQWDGPGDTGKRV